MKKKYLIIPVLVILLIILSSLFFLEIPSPSILVSEDYQLEIK